jgi:phosphoglycolate phosphatase
VADSPAPAAAAGLVVFDLDGTLIDSRRDLANTANAVLAAYGCSMQSEEAIGRMVGDGAATLVARAFEAAGVSQPPDALPRFLEIYDTKLLEHTRPYAGMMDVLNTLERRALLALLTNKPLAATRVILDGLGLTRHFGARVVGGDGPLPKKPDPAGLAHLVADAGLPLEEVLMVGDSKVDWQTAATLGVRVCLAGYGFGFAAFPPSLLRPEDTVIAHPRELLRLV